MNEPWQVGDYVVCVDPPPERSFPIFQPLVLGRHYRILAVRDAGLTPPKGSIPDEIRLNTTTVDGEETSLFYSSDRFKLIDKS